MLYPPYRYLMKIVSNSNGVNSNNKLVRFWLEIKIVSNSNGVNSNQAVQARTYTDEKFQTPTE